jgi:glycosyltransferase involved in cell wall biosynthesis
MKVLFYTGYFKNPWSPHNMEGLGGSEIAVVQVAERLSHFGWKVVVSGDVEEGVWNGVEWLPTNRLHEKYFDQFDVIVGVSYLHFTLEFDEYNAKRLFWIHNTDFHPWYCGTEIADPETLLTPGDIDGFVCLTNWHKEQWSQKYSLDPERFHIIGNGIDPTSFIGEPQKIKNRFIWSSAPERGLTELLTYWPIIKNRLPEASLHIYSPGYQIAKREDWTGHELVDVEFMGSVSQPELHRAMGEAEYWMYLTSYEETYCITALEMQKAGVFPITTNTAALNETVNSGIILEDNKQKWNIAIQILTNMSIGLKEKALESNRDWIKRQTWNSRSYDWKNLIEEICK